jgi:8-amino-7-oxononanoate synthase
MSNFPKKLQARIDARLRAGNYRALSYQSGGVDFTSNDYLGLALKSWDSSDISSSHQSGGSGGSRLLGGNSPEFEVAEQSIATFHRAEAALLFNSGYDANLGLLSSILQRNDIVIYDSSVHASIRDGISLGLARSYKFAHNSLEDLKTLSDRVVPQNREGAEVYVITESVFSMEGDGPDLKAFAHYCEAMGFHLILDEAHAIGIMGPDGRGMAIEAGIESLLFARIITFGKALGCHGAAVLCSLQLRHYLINFCRSFIYTTALPPQTVRHIIRSYNWLQTPDFQSALTTLKERIGYFQERIFQLEIDNLFIPGNAAIRCCVIGGNERVKAISDTLRNAGYDIRPILSPTVSPGMESLRFILHSFNTEAEIDHVLLILANTLTSIQHER